MCDEKQKDTEMVDAYIEQLERKVFFLEDELTESQLLNIQLRLKVAELSRNNNIYN